MARDTYISIGKKVNGFSFANLGLFTGFADGVYNAVYSLVILEIFKSSAIVGVYVAIYSVFCFIVGLFESASALSAKTPSSTTAQPLPIPPN